MLYPARNPRGVPCLQRDNSCAQNISDKRRNQRDLLEDVDGIGKAGFVFIQRVDYHGYSDANGYCDTDWQGGLLELRR